MRIPLFLLLLILTTWPATARQPGPVQHIQLEKTFHTTTGQRLELGLATTATVTLMGWDKEAVVVEVDMEGQYLEVTSRQEEGVVYVRSRFTQVADAAFARGTVRVKLPYGLAVRGKLTGGDLTLRELRGETQIQTGEGFITGYDLQGQLLLEAYKGQVELFGGHIEGEINALHGSIKVSELRGRFALAAEAGQFSVNSFAEPVHGQIKGGQMTLSVRDADVKGDAFKSNMEVSWQGDPGQAKHHLSLSGTNSRITVYLPETLGLDAEFDQLSTDNQEKPAPGPPAPNAPVTTSSLESDFALGTLPAARTFTHQGKPHKLVQVRRKINNGGHQLQVQAANSQVKLKKLKQNAR
jgi:hypothetical protein